MAELSKTVDKMVAILKVLADGRVASAREISETLGINRTVVQRLLATLQAQDFVARLGSDGYALSFRVSRLAEQVLPELRQAARPVARALAQRAQTTVTLQVVDGAEAAVVVEELPTAPVLQVRHLVGSRSPLRAGAGGRALLAFADARTVRRASISGAEDLEALAEIRRTRLAVSTHELQPGVQAIASPVFDGDGAVVASLGLLVPQERETRLSELHEPLAAAAEQIGRRLSVY